MNPLDCPCEHKSIPERLHSLGRTRVSELSLDDWIFLRHHPLKPDESYTETGIPGFTTKQQSVISRDLNPSGGPKDVLYDGGEGVYREDQVVAGMCIRAIAPLPNERSRVRKSDGTETVDVYSFLIVHDPDGCMYPHCVIKILKGEQESVVNNTTLKTAIRQYFGKLVEPNAAALAATPAPPEILLKSSD